MGATDGAVSRWLQSVRVRIVSVLVILLLASSAGSVYLLRTELVRSLDDEVETSLTREADEFERLVGGNNPRTGQPFAGDLRSIFEVYFARELPDEGETLLAFVNGELIESRRSQDAASADELGDAIQYWLSLTEREDGSMETSAGPARYVALPLDGDRQRGLFVVVNFPAFEKAEIDESVRSLSLIQLAALVAASLLALALAGRVLRPLRELADTARHVSETDLSTRIRITGRDEASQIAATFNDMLARLESTFSNHRRFLDDTSHELRAPLTIIRGHVELLELDDTPEARRATVRLVTEEIDRLTRMVNDLLLLARAEQPEFTTMAPTDIAGLVLDVHQKVATLADRQWDVVAPGPTVILADPARLTQALLQLADNAVKHTSDGDRIEIGVAHQPGETRLWVDDAGTGVAREDHAAIFDRFSQGLRADESRGAGLGLSIVSTIAHHHGGTVQLVDRSGHGARFEIRLPDRGGARVPDPLRADRRRRPASAGPPPPSAAGRGELRPRR